MTRDLLLIEDDEIQRELLLLQLSAAGWQVHAFSCGEELLAAAPALPAAATVLCDLQLPGVCGSALATELRSIVQPRRVLAMTATLNTPLPAGYDAVLTKPFTPEDVMEHAAGEATECDPQVDAGKAGALLLRMPAGTARQMLEMSMEDAAIRVQAMTAAAQDGDPDTLSRQAHALKGTAAMLGANALRNLAAEAETNPLAFSPAPFYDTIRSTRRMLDQILPNPELL